MEELLIEHLVNHGLEREREIEWGKKRGWESMQMHVRAAEMERRDSSIDASQVVRCLSNACVVKACKQN